MNADRLMKIAALTWYDFDAMPAEDIGAIIKECLDAVAEEQAKRELACEALGPFAEWAVLSNKWADDTWISGWELKAGNFRAARDAVAQCQPEANPLEDLRKMLRECRATLVSLEQACGSLLLEARGEAATDWKIVDDALRERTNRVLEIDAAIGEDDDE